MYNFLDKIGLKSVMEAVKGKIPTVSNPNLLINPDFRINQRNNGGLMFNGSVGKFFIADRWKIYDNNTSSSGRITRNDDGSITLSVTKAYCDIMQVFEIPIEEGYYTLSAKINGEIRTHTGYLAKGAQITSNDQGLVLDETSFRVRCLQGQTITVEWAKLEIGRTATPFSPPNPTTELIKCQRYYQIHNLARQRIWYYTADTLVFFLPNKVPMRDGRTATINGTLNITSMDNKSQSGFNFVVDWAIADGVKVRAEKTAHGLTDAILYVNGLPSGGQIEIDAEI